MAENNLEDIATTDDILCAKYESLSVRRSVDKRLCIFAGDCLWGVQTLCLNLGGRASLACTPQEGSTHVPRSPARLLLRRASDRQA